MRPTTEGTGDIRPDMDTISQTDAAAASAREKTELETLVGRLDGWAEQEVNILALKEGFACWPGFEIVIFYFIFPHLFFLHFFPISLGGRRFRARQRGRGGDQAQGEETAHYHQIRR